MAAILPDKITITSKEFVIPERTKTVAGEPQTLTIEGLSSGDIAKIYISATGVDSKECVAYTVPTIAKDKKIQLYVRIWAKEVPVIKEIEITE